MACGNAAPVILDEAFTHARPALTGEFRQLQARFLGQGGSFVAIGAEKAADAIVEAARAAGYAKAGDGKGAIITSPLFAAALVAGERGLEPTDEQGGIQALGGLRLVVPEWHGAVPTEVKAISTDYLAAYRSAGRAAGSYVAALRAAGEKGATGGILFRAGPSRGQEALEAFSEGFTATAGFPPVAEKLAEAADEDGMAIGRLLSVDLRIVLVAAGRENSASCGKLARPGLAIGLENTDPAAFQGASFVICPDEAGIARAASGAARLLGSAPGASMEALYVPARLLSFPRAGDFQAGKTDLGRLLAGEGAGKYPASGGH